MEEKDYEVFMDDRTVVTNRLLIDLLLCMKHHHVQDWVGDAPMQEIFEIIKNWSPREISINEKFKELMDNLLGNEMVCKLAGKRLEEFHEAASSDKMIWGYR